MPLSRPSLGTLAPDIELFDADDRSWRLHEQRGRTQLLIFHRHAH